MAGACVAFVAALTIEQLVSSIFALKIECSSKGMDLASWIPASEWERSERSGVVRMNAGGFFIAVPVNDCESNA